MPYRIKQMELARSSGPFRRALQYAYYDWTREMPRSKRLTWAVDPPRRSVRFAAFELDVRAGELRKYGVKIRLQEQPFQVLLMLLERSGEVVLREEIRKKLWPNDTIVEFAPSINAAIQRLRDALGDSAVQPRYVETVARRGYRFIGELLRDEPALEPPQPSADESISDASDLTGRTLLHYQVYEKLGRGGMGEVYRARDTRLGREVALKVLPEEFARDADRMARFEREAQVLASLNHPNISAIYDLEEANGIRALVMELVEGQTLAERIARGAIPLEEALAIARQTADALEAAHEKGIVHRDLKPANVKITPQGGVKVLDFGLAAVMQGSRVVLGDPEKSPTRTATLSQTGVILGTAAYMAPEQARAEGVDKRADIWAFGVVLYEMLTGRRLFEGETTTEILSAVLTKEPDWARVPQKVKRLLGSCLERDLKRRLRDIGEVWRQLEDAPQVPAPPGKSLAVLYFQNLGDAKEQEYFRDGITEDIITELTKIQELRLFPRSAVLPYRDKPAPAPEIGRQLSTAYLLDGSLRRKDNRVRVTVQLVETRTGHSIWAERYDRELKDIFEVQEDIARSIAQALRITLSPREETEIALKPTKNPQAYDYYLRGRSYARRCTRPDLEFAMQMYEHAITLDASFAPAHAGLASACGLFYDWHEHDRAWLDRGLAASNRALALEPQLADALAAGARIHWAQQQFDDAIRDARAAIARKPDCEGAYWTVGQALFATDRWEELIALTPRALEVSGDDYNVYIPLFAAAERRLQTELARRLQHQFGEVLKRHLEWVPEDVRARILLAANYAFFQEEAYAMRELHRAVAQRPDDSNILYNAACVYGILKNQPEALALLNRASDAGLSKWDWVARDPDLACLHGVPEFQQLIEAGKSKAGTRNP